MGESGLNRSYNDLGIDDFEDDKLGADKKSMAYSFTYQSLKKTLTDKNVEKLHKKIVDRICQDEVIHVTSLRTFLGELRSVTLETIDGGTIAGSEIVDRLWAEQLRMTLQQPNPRREQQEKELRSLIREHPNGAEIERRFDALG